jgi:hypothetical protein
MINHNKNLVDQAMFFCLVRNDSPLDKTTKVESFEIITRLMKGYRNISLKMNVADFTVNALLAFQLADDSSLVVRAVSCILDKAEKLYITPGNAGVVGLNRDEARKFCKKIAVESPDFFAELVFHGKSYDSAWPKTYSEIVNKSGLFQPKITGDLRRYNKKSVSLLSVIKRSDNPFAHENAALALLTAVLNNGNFQETTKVGDIDYLHPHQLIDLSNCKVTCDDWERIQSLDTQITISTSDDNDPLFPLPEWIEDAHKPLYRLGAFLRSCLLGNVDWSSANVIQSGQPRYSGLKSSFAKRQLGMMHSPEALNGETAPMSNWVSSLLSYLLQWPGTNLHEGNYEWPKEWNIKSLRNLVTARLEYQKSIFCKMSGIPAYVEKLGFKWPIDKKALKVVMVQSLLPLKGDFHDHGLMLDTVKYRARHRRHIAAVAELILHKAHSQRSIDDENHKDSSIDLIVWPELAVNNEDIDILKQLANKTGAIIFLGLGFTNLTGIDGPNNVAKWLIPQKLASGRKFMNRLQGKQNMMKDEVGKIKPWRPYQLLIELIHPAFPKERGFTLTGSICFDATDIKINADLKDKSDAYLVVALNQDVTTFDSMVDALYYHMYQHVALVNTGEFGGSVAKAPYKERHEKLITHVHGAHQVSISSFEMNMFDFRDVGKSYRSGKSVKTKPAG